MFVNYGKCVVYLATSVTPPNGWEYSINQDNTATLHRYVGQPTTVTVPSTIA